MFVSRIIGTHKSLLIIKAAITHTAKLAREINLRNTPEIRFVMDQSIAYGVSMSKKIDEVTKDLKEERQKEDDL